MSDFEPLQRPPAAPFNAIHGVGRGPLLGMPPRESLKPLNGFAIVSLWLMIFWFSIPAIITGHVALYQLSFTGFERGKGMARTALILAYLQLLAVVLFFVFVGVHIIAAIVAFFTGLAVVSDPGASADGLAHMLEGLTGGGATPTPAPSDLSGLDPNSPEYKELLKALKDLANQ
jgi:hypothetical protein